MYYDVIMTGFGGQGIQTISLIMALASINKGMEVTYLPSYGVEKRGGRTDVYVTVSDQEIGSPITNTPKALIALDGIGLAFYQKMLQPGSLLIANTSLIKPDEISFRNGKVVALKFNDEAIAMGNPKLANMVTLGAFISRIDFLTMEDVEAVIGDVIPERLKEMIPLNLRAIQQGMDIAG
jgi:2-oxoglutarate ferredoxin oxidoreductase subunit gamma